MLGSVTSPLAPLPRRGGQLELVYSYITSSTYYIITPFCIVLFYNFEIMRKALLYISLTLLLLLIGGVIWHVGYLNGLATKKSYPEDTWLAKCDKKEALIIVAHDDDAVACAGTISRLTNEGWTVREFCFYDEGNADRIKSRKEGTKRTQDIQGLKDFGWINQSLRKKSDSSAALSIPYAAFDSVYRTNDIDTLIKALIYH